MAIRTRGAAASKVLVEPLEPRRLLSGVTLITHGYEPTSSARPGWLDSMANAIVGRAGPGTSVYDLVIALNSGGTAQVTSFSLLSGPGLSSSPNGEAVVMLDWADASGIVLSYTSTATIAQLVEPYLVTAFPSLGITSPLADAAIHLIGHSRGGSVVSELANDLGQSGIWVDQLTTLDPHPVAPDPSVNPYGNVVFADNYYETDSLTPGQSVQGAHNVNLSGVFPAGLIDQHEDVHAYYHGTIDTGASNDGDAGGSIAIDPTWYGYQGAGPRDSTGFDYSLLGGGVRPADGIGQAYGGTAARVSIAGAAGPQWANVGDLVLTDPGATFQVGQALHAQYLFQDDSHAPTVSFYLDSDQNPLDASPAYQVGTQTFAQGAGVLHPTSAAQLDTSGLPPGQYYLVAKISDGQTTRYAYDAAPITLTQPPAIYLPDLSGAIVYAPTTLPPGGKRNPMVLTIKNLGNLRLNGTVPINLYASQTASYDASAVSVAIVSARVNLPAGGEKVVTLRFNSPANVPNGNYYLLAFVNQGPTWQESDYGNNIAAASMTTAITQPFVDPTGSIQSSPAVLYRGRRAAAYVTLTNNGNVPANGLFAAQALLSPDNVGGDGAILLGTQSRKLTLRPGRSIRLKISFVVPQSGDGMYLEGVISFSGSLVDSDISNNTFFSGAPVTLS